MSKKVITENDVKHIANLARIHLKDEEIQPLTKDMERILDYIKQLEQLNVDNIEPTSHVLALKNVVREDTVQPSLSQEEVLKYSVEQLNGSFKVAKVIE